MSERALRAASSAWAGAFPTSPKPSLEGPPKSVREPRRVGSIPMGMVQVGSLTFSILQLTPTSYGVVRVLDDRFLGTFENHPSLEVFPEHSIDVNLLRAIARIAIRQGRTAWSGEH